MGQQPEDVAMQFEAHCLTFIFKDVLTKTVNRNKQHSAAFLRVETSTRLEAETAR